MGILLAVSDLLFADLCEQSRPPNPPPPSSYKECLGNIHGSISYKTIGI